jgi:hypothetical protein
MAAWLAAWARECASAACDGGAPMALVVPGRILHIKAVPGDESSAAGSPGDATAWRATIAPPSRFADLLVSPTWWADHDMGITYRRVLEPTL